MCSVWRRGQLDAWNVNRLQRRISEDWRDDLGAVSRSWEFITDAGSALPAAGAIFGDPETASSKRGGQHFRGRIALINGSKRFALLLMTSPARDFASGGIHELLTANSNMCEAHPQQPEPLWTQP